MILSTPHVLFWRSWNPGECQALSTNEFIPWEDSSQSSAFLMLHSISCIIHPKSAAPSRAVKGEVCNGLRAPATASRGSSASWSSQREQFGDFSRQLSFSSSLPHRPTLLSTFQRDAAAKSTRAWAALVFGRSSHGINSSLLSSKE